MGPLVGAAIELSSKTLIGIGTAILTCAGSAAGMHFAKKRGYAEGEKHGLEANNTELEKQKEIISTLKAQIEALKQANNGDSNNNGGKK